MAFQDKYLFAKDNNVVIEHRHGGTLRVAPKNNDCKANGGRGKLARWRVELLGDDRLRIKSLKTGKYLRIARNGDLDVKGGQGNLTVFKFAVIEDPNVVTLESEKLEGKFVGVNPKKKAKSGNGGIHCHLTFYKDGDEPQPEPDAEAEDEAEDEPEDESEDENEDEPEPEPEAEDEKDEKEAEAAAAEPLSEDAEAVKTWLTTVGYEAYFDTFVENGYDKMSTVSMIDTSDLEKMGVKAGHQKEIMLAARAAPFINHWVAFRSQHKPRFVATDEGNKKKLETKDENAPKDCRWFVEASPNGSNLVRFRSTYDTYIRIPNDEDKHMVTVDADQIEDQRSDLQILPIEGSKKFNVVNIWCPSNANFMTYDDNVMKDRVNASLQETEDEEKIKKQQWEIIISE